MSALDSKFALAATSNHTPNNAVSDPAPPQHQNASEMPPLTDLDQEIETFVGELNANFEINRWKEIMLIGDLLEIILTGTRVSALATAFYTQAEREGRIVRLEKPGRIKEFIEFTINGNLKTLAILLYSGCGYHGLWFLHNQGQFMKSKIRTINEQRGQKLMKGGENLDNLPETSRLAFDNFLPVGRDDALDLLGWRLGSNFHDNQYAFMPVQLRQYEHFDKTHDPKLRLPIRERIFIGTGASSDAYEIIIAPRGWSDEHGRYNPQATTIVQKIYSGGRKEEPEEQRDRENGMLQSQRLSPTHHVNIVPCYGSLDTEDEVSLLFPAADMTLATLLASDKFRKSTQFRQYLESFKGLGDALAFLHEFGICKDGRNCPVYHRDFRPDNVFIFGLDDYKVADFGMSRVLALESDGTLKDIRPSRENGGTYSAPPNVIGMGRDVWGFVAMIIVTIVYKIGGPNIVEDFESARANGPHEHDRFWIRDEGGAITLNHHMVEWIELTLTPAMKRAYAEEISGPVGKLLDLLVHDCFASLISSSSSDDSGPPGARDIMTHLGRTVDQLPEKDVERCLDSTPESSMIGGFVPTPVYSQALQANNDQICIRTGVDSISSSFPAFSTGGASNSNAHVAADSVDSNNESMSVQLSVDNRPLSYTRLAAEENAMFLIGSTAEIRSPLNASDTATTPFLRERSSFIGDGSELTSATSVYRSEGISQQGHQRLAGDPSFYAANSGPATPQAHPLPELCWGEGRSIRSHQSDRPTSHVSLIAIYPAFRSGEQHSTQVGMTSEPPQVPRLKKPKRTWRTLLHDVKTWKNTRKR